MTHLFAMQAGEQFALILFLTAVASVLVLEAAALLREVRDRLRGAPAAPPTAARHLLHALAAFGVIAILYGYFREPFRLTVTRLELPTAKVTSRVRLVQLSDTHCDLRKRLEDDVVATVNGLNPDLILFTGDTLNAAEALPAFKAMMTPLRAKAGKFACLGNYDVFYWPGLDLFGGTGFVPLDGTTAVRVGSDEIRLAGLPLHRFRDLPRFAPELPSDTYSILLYHTPDLAESLGATPFDLYLAGHTHGGQVALPFYGALVTFSRYGKKYEAGRYDLGPTTLYVSRGIGMEGGAAPRVRFWAPPEIVVIDLVPSGPRPDPGSS